MDMTHGEIREKFRKFFESKGHKWVASSSLLPSDPSVLFTTAGMQQFKPYYTGAADAMKDFGSLNTASIQKSMRTSDIDEVGDDSHLTFFEMLGNFSFGDYWKREAIAYAHEFITKEMGLTIDYVSVFEGEANIPADEESQKIWQELAPGITIKKFGRADNFWGPTGTEGPCGPTTEIYVNGVEIWNIVFNEYYQNADGTLKPLETKGIDTGMGLERLAMAVQQKRNVFETDLFSPVIEILPAELKDWAKRIIADHTRASVFMISDGMVPSNKEQGYVLRRLLRRMAIQLSSVGINHELIISKIIEQYKSFYTFDAVKILDTVNVEIKKFQNTLAQGRKELESLQTIDEVSAFTLYQSYGLPFEVIKDLGGEKAASLTREKFDEEYKRHQDISRAGAEKKFGGHGMTDGEADPIKVRLHTATHLVVAALEKVLGEKLPQAGSDITAERLRFDFKFPRKVTPEELKQAEDMANEIVAKDVPVTCEEMDVDKAFKSGASGAFKDKYGDRVKVYSIGEPGNYFSRELCGGPHVTHTGEVGHITIIKEESVSGGNRRIRATVE